MTVATRIVNGFVFDIPSPSVWYLHDEPVMLIYDGATWSLSFLDKDNVRREGRYIRRQAAIDVLTSCYRRKGA